MTHPSEALLRRLASLQAGRKIDWTPGTTVEGSNGAAIHATGSNVRPSVATEGVDLAVEDSGTALEAFWRVKLRAGKTQKAVVTVVTVENAETYTVTVNGNPADYLSDGSATQAEILAGLKLALDALGEPITVVDTGPGTQLDIEGDASVVAGLGPITFAVSGTGAAELGLTNEASSVTFEVWYRPDALDTADDGFDRLDFGGGVYQKTVAQNASDRMDVAGIKEAKVVFLSADGTSTGLIGKATIETG